MRLFFIRHFLGGAAALLFGLLLCGGPSGRAAAQDIWKPKTRTEPTPPKQDISITRQTGRRKRRVRVERAQPDTLLQVQWQLRKFTDDGVRKLVNAADTFSPQDRLLFSIKVNQNGYLYIIRQQSADGEGQLLFPSKHYNAGRSSVREDQELVLPSDCSNYEAPCWFRMHASAAEERLTVIFSRAPVADLPGEVLTSGGPHVVTAQTLSKLLAASAQQLRRTDGIKLTGVQDDRNTFWVKNENAKNNREIIYTLSLKGSGSVKADAGPAAKN